VDLPFAEPEHVPEDLRLQRGSPEAGTLQGALDGRRNCVQAGRFTLLVFFSAVQLAVAPGRTSLAAGSEEEKPRIWSFQALRQASVPVVHNSAWVKNPVDSFVLSRLEQEHLAPTGSANKLALLRRVTLDLTGLPPTPEEIHRFLSDSRPEAYTEVIDRLLSSPRYGEYWGRHWLDVARYADTGGFEADLPYKDAWQYRDYVIRSLNADKPFNRFVQEQVAGDELWPGNPEAAIATAFYCVGPVLQESAMISNQLEYEWLTDATDTTGAAFMGVTLGCARCHNHKYDPITQKDYFAMQAIFAASDRTYPDKVREQRIKALHGLLAEKPLPDELKDDPQCTVQTEERCGLKLRHREQPLEVHLLRRGELSKPREVVEPAFLSDLLPDRDSGDLAKAPPEQRRAALAKWLTSPEINPLPARVVVNRVWTWHFGQGIVRTPNDFGRQGEAPTHPELLEWLTADFLAHGWSLKHLHRLILLSATYQMESVATPESVRLDPENRLLSHFPRRRLDAESIWDCLHAAAGTLNLKQFGPPVVPALTKDELTGLFLANDKWPVSKDPSEHERRGIYMFVRRTFTFPVFDAFDPPDNMASCPRRLETTVPAQALTLLNSKSALTQARAFAERLLRDCETSDPVPLVDQAWLLAYQRPITAPERDRALGYLRARKEAIESESGAAEPAEAPLESALVELCLALFNSNQFVYID
jgi:hypothetical protein